MKILTLLTVIFCGLAQLNTSLAQTGTGETEPVEPNPTPTSPPEAVIEESKPNEATLEDSEPLETAQPEPPPQEADIKEPEPVENTPNGTSPPSSATESSVTRARRMLLLLGPGFSIGAFFPKDVNAIMTNWMNEQGDIVVEQSGSAEMYVNMVPRVAINFGPIEYVQIQALGEIGWGPKMATIVNGDSEFFNFVRYSVGGTLNAHIPIRNFRNSILIGGGVLYHWMRFNEFEADTLGFRGLAGVRFYSKRKSFTPEVFIAFDYAKGSTGNSLIGQGTASDGSIDYDAVLVENVELNFTSFVIGGNFYFKLAG